jgi:hypothetical protein
MRHDLDAALDRLAAHPDDGAMAAVAAAAPAAEVSQVARLTRLQAESGGRLGPPSAEVVDIASSGGPGSLSTLLAPLYARALGAKVAKIAVPGRPAGGLDVLASLRGYNPDLDPAAARAILDDCGYVHVAAGAASHGVRPTAPRPSPTWPSPACSPRRSPAGSAGSYSTSASDPTATSARRSPRLAPTPVV